MEGLEDQLNRRFLLTWKLMILNIKIWMFQIRIARLHQLLKDMNKSVMSLFDKDYVFYVFEPVDFNFTFISIAQFSTSYV